MAVVLIEPDARAVAVRAADVVAQAARASGFVLGVATGSSPLGLYAQLVRRADTGDLDLRGATVFALDEYVGLPDEHPESYRAVVNREIVIPFGIDPDRVFVPDGNPENLATSGARFEKAITDAGGIDLQILGIGANSHVGFNEPGSSLDSTTRVARLSESTRRANARFFPHPEAVPHWCVTQGLGTILRSRSLLLIATGEAKAEAVARALEGPVTPQCPASIIQLHPAATVIIDEDAAALLADRREVLSATGS